MSECSFTITCAMVNSRYIGDGHPTFNRNPYSGYIKVDDHPLLYGNNGSLDPGTCAYNLLKLVWQMSNFKNEPERQITPS